MAALVTVQNMANTCSMVKSLFFALACYEITLSDVLTGNNRGSPLLAGRIFVCLTYVFQFEVAAT